MAFRPIGGPLCRSVILKSRTKELAALWEARNVQPENSGANPGDGADATPIDAYLDEFYDDKAKGIGFDEAEDGTREKVRSGTYVQDLQSVLPKWVDWMRGHGYTTLADLDGRAIGEWAQALSTEAKKEDEEERDFGPATAWKRFRYVSAYLKYLQEWEYIDTNPARTGPAKQRMPDKPSSSSADQQFWSQEQRDRLMLHVEERAHDTIDEHGTDRAAYNAVRDRAFCSVIAYSAARGSELLNQPDDDRDGRNGATWGDLNLEKKRLDVLGKSQDSEEVPLTSNPIEPLKRWRALLDPPSEDWPLFPTLHRPTLWGTLRDALETRGLDDVDGALDDYDRPLVACEALEVRPPALTVDGGRKLMRRLTKASEVDVEDDPKDYLTLHGGRRGAGEVYHRHASLDDAQLALRHDDSRVTKEMYSHISTEDVSEVGDEAFEKASENSRT